MAVAFCACVCRVPRARRPNTRTSSAWPRCAPASVPGGWRSQAAELPSREPVTTPAIPSREHVTTPARDFHRCSSSDSALQRSALAFSPPQPSQGTLSCCMRFQWRACRNSEQTACLAARIACAASTKRGARWSATRALRNGATNAASTVNTTRLCARERALHFADTGSALKRRATSTSFSL